LSLFKIFSVILVLCLSLPAQAGLLFEPYAGYAMGDHKSIDATTEQTQSGNIDGFAYGAKAGWMFGRFFLGGEYQASRAQRKMDGTAEAVNWANTSIFGVIGLQSQVGLRISAAMTVTPHTSVESSLPERTTYTGSAKKLSIGYHYRIPLALNVDYIIYEFDKYKQGESKGDIKERFSKFEYSTLMLSLSFPFEMH